jgi:hypothetical protein
MDRGGASAGPLMAGEAARRGNMMVKGWLEPACSTGRPRVRAASPGQTRDALRPTGRDAVEGDGHPGPGRVAPTRYRGAAPSWAVAVAMIGPASRPGPITRHPRAHLVARRRLHPGLMSRKSSARTACRRRNAGWSEKGTTTIHDCDARDDPPQAPHGSLRSWVPTGEADSDGPRRSAMFAFTNDFFTLADGLG